MKSKVLTISAIIFASLAVLASCGSAERSARILQATQQIYEKATPPSYNYTVNLTEAQNDTLQSWENWRVGRSRMRSNYTVPQDYAPEVGEYPISIYWSSTGLGFVITGVVFFILFIVFIVGRFGFNSFGARYEKKKKLERCVKHTPTVFYGFGVVLMFIGITIQMVGTLNYNHYVHDAADLAINQADLQYNNTKSAFSLLQSTSDAKLTYNDVDGREQTYNSSSVAAEQTIVMQGVTNMQNTSKNFSSEIRSSYNPTSGALWFFFAITVVLVFPAGFVYFKKIAVLAILFGVLGLLMLGFPWVFAASYFRNQLYLADICHKVNLTITDLSGQRPLYGSGLFMHMNCLKSTEGQNLGNLIFESQDDLVNALDTWRAKANKTDGANTAAVNAVMTVDDAKSMSAIAPYSNNADLVQWTNKILKPTYDALRYLIDTKDCKYTCQWAIDAQTKMCYHGLYYNYLGLIGDIMMFFGFFFTALGLVLAKNVFERMREAARNMANRSDLNLEI